MAIMHCSGETNNTRPFIVAKETHFMALESKDICPTSASIDPASLPLPGSFSHISVVISWYGTRHENPLQRSFR